MMAPRFIGRVAELNSITGLCSPSLEGKGTAAVLVEGPPGSGKTRLLTETEERLAKWPCLRVAGYQTALTVPLAAAAGMLRRLAASADDSVLRSLFDRGSELAQGPLEALRLFEAARRALVATNTALIGIDDLQWVDESSLALVEYLIRASLSEGTRLAVVATARPSAAAIAFTDATVRELGRERTRLVRLGPLAEEDGIRLAQQMAPQLDRQAAAELWREAEGWPFWLEQLVAGDGRGGIAEQLAVRLRSTSPDGGRLAALLAAAGRPLALHEVPSLLVWPEARCEQAIIELARLGIAFPTAGAVAFAHDLVRESAERVVPASERRHLHGRLADWIEAGAGADMQALRQALWHRSQAGSDVLELATRVAQSPERRLLGGRGLRDLGEMADAAGDRGLQLNEAVAALAAELGQHRDALARWRRVTERHPDPQRRAWAALRASRAATNLIEHRAEAMDLLRRACAESTADPLLEVEIDAQKANLLRLLEHQNEEARALAARAAAGARRLLAAPSGAEPRGREAVLAGLEAAYEQAIMDEDHQAQVVLAEEMLAATRGSDEGHLVAMLTVARAFATVSRIREAAERAGHVWSEAKRLTMPALQLAAGPSQITMLRQSGRLEEAEAVSSECVELQGRLAGPVQRLAIPRVALRSARVLRNVVLMSRGRWREGIAQLEREAELEPDPHYRIHIRQELALWLSRLGSAAERTAAMAHFTAAEEDSRHARCPRCARELTLRGAEVRARLSTGEAARRLLSDWDHAPGGSEPADVLWRRHVAALVDVGGGLALAGALELEELASRRRDMGLLYDRLWALLDAGQALALARGEGRRAAEILRQAGAEAAEMGAVTEQQLAEQALRRLGVRTWRRSAAARGERPIERLSERQRQIARMVASGASNREIGAVLFLSPKTVERHVSNMYAQTGVRNRTELAALLGAESEP
jgi:DNA-binding CsgD family transcriptional regulator